MPSVRRAMSRGYRSGRRRLGSSVTIRRMSDRARDLGIRIGRGSPGPLNAITDVSGVRVGHRSIVRGDDGDHHAIRTGVTAVFPHEGFPWSEHVYAATHILNGYGELIGINQITEWGVLMSPVVLTSS